MYMDSRIVGKQLAAVIFDDTSDRSNFSLGGGKFLVWWYLIKFSQRNFFVCIMKKNYKIIDKISLKIKPLRNYLKLR